MTFYILQRLLLGLLTILLIVSFAFVLLRVAPGDPASVWLGPLATPETLRALHHAMGLDQPIWVQYGLFIRQLLSGDLGISLNARRPVLGIILDQYPFTLQLTVGSLVAAIVLGLPLGALAAWYRNSWIDLSAGLAVLGWLALPSFWLGMILLLVFAVNLSWFPLLGAGDRGNVGSIILHLVLPSIALGARQAAVIARMTRSSVLEVLNEDYIRTARAKGAGERRVLTRHVLRNALGPVINVSALDTISLLGGAVVTEAVFSRPGIGSLLAQSVSQRDYTMVQGCLLFFAASVVVISLAADLIQGGLDPRVRNARRGVVQ